MTTLVQKIDKFAYPDYENYWDVKLFAQKIDYYITEQSIVLDLGAGANSAHLNFKGRARLVCGIDLDQRVMQNPSLDEAKIASAESIPYCDQTFDAVISIHVLEHLENPAKVFREVRRVLKPDGMFLVKTPNKFHYVPLLGRSTPQRFHKFYNKIRGREESDTFPTFYRANSKKAIMSLARQENFAVEKIELTEGRPEYLRINAPLYLLGLLYEQIVNSSALFSNFRSVLIAHLRKKV